MSDLQEDITQLSAMKHILWFNKLRKNMSVFFEEECLSLSELITIMTMYALKDDETPKNSTWDVTFRKYYKFYMDGIASGDLKEIKGVPTHIA